MTFILAWSQLVLPLLILPIVVAANWHAKPPGGNGPSKPARHFGQAVWVLLGAVVAACLLLGFLSLLEPGTDQPTGSGPAVRRDALAGILALTGVLAGAILSHRVRATIARLIPIHPDSALDATALVLTIVMTGTQLADQVAVDVLSQQAAAGAALEPIDLITQEVPFLLAALLGVGLLTRRDLPATLARLGLVRPRARELLLALAAAGAFYAFSVEAEKVIKLLTPDLANKVDAANQRLFARLGDPAGIATIALSAGICEEALFRGALQPRLGILWTSLVFATIHTQYGLSLTAVVVLVLSIGLAWLRRLTNTTSSTICHVAYNTLVGIGVGGSWLVPALVVEAGLTIGALSAFLTGRRLGSPRIAQ